MADDSGGIEQVALEDMANITIHTENNKPKDGGTGFDLTAFLNDCNINTGVCTILIIDSMFFDIFYSSIQRYLYYIYNYAGRDYKYIRN